MKNSIRKKLILRYSAILIAMIFIVTCTSFFLFWNIYNRQTCSLMNDQMLQMTENLEYRIKTIEDKSFDILTSSVIQRQLVILSGNRLAPSELLRTENTLQSELSRITLFNDEIAAVSIVSDNNRKITVNRTSSGESSHVFSREELAEKNGSVMWGLDAQTGNIIVSRAILDLDSMELLGYLTLECHGSYFSEITMSNSETVYLVNDNGQIMASSNSRRVGQTLSVPLSGISYGNPSFFDTFSREELYLKSGVLANEWTLLLTVPYAELFRGLNTFLCLILLTMILALAAGILIIRTISLQIMHPIELLLDSMKGFGKGDLSRRVSLDSQDEIAQLGQEYNHMAENIEHLIEKVLNMELSQKQAELEFLRMQINPHFLFNTLDTINWMAISARNTDISEMIMALAELLRTTIKSEPLVSLETELYTVKNYLKIQEYRFRDKITVSCSYDETLALYEKTCMLPSLILQPLIENAITHGLEPEIRHGNLTLKICSSGSLVHFEVQDDGTGIPSGRLKKLQEEMQKDTPVQTLKRSRGHRHSGIGLKNVNRRLVYYYGRQAELQIHSEKGNGTTVSFSIPVIPSEPVL